MVWYVIWILVSVAVASKCLYSNSKEYEWLAPVGIVSALIGIFASLFEFYKHF